MNAATKTLAKQKKIYFSYVWRGLAIMAIGICGAVMVYQNGYGKIPDRKGPAMILYNLIKKLAGEGPGMERRMALILSGIFGIIALIGFYNFIRGAGHMASKHTVLGKSILHQAKSYEKFGDVLNSINLDIAQGAYSFGKVSIGREWILETEAMRLSGVRGVFWMDVDEDDYVLCCVDDNKNIWASSMQYKDERDKAMDCLLKRYPELVSGDKEAYISFVN